MKRKVSLGRGHDVHVAARVYVWHHPRPDGSGECEECIPRLGPDAWTVVDPHQDHLTLAPIVTCSKCGVEGWIIKSKWVPA